MRSGPEGVERFGRGYVRVGTYVHLPTWILRRETPAIRVAARNP